MHECVHACVYACVRVCEAAVVKEIYYCSTTDEAWVAENFLFVLFLTAQVGKRVDDDTKDEVENDDDDDKEKYQVIDDTSKEQPLLFQTHHIYIQGVPKKRTPNLFL